MSSVANDTGVGQLAHDTPNIPMPVTFARFGPWTIARPWPLVPSPSQNSPRASGSASPTRS